VTRQLLLIRILSASVLVCSAGAPWAHAEEGNKQRPPLSAQSGECHIADTQPLFSEKTAGATYKRVKVNSKPLTWKESFHTDRPAAEVTIAHRGCEDISSTIRLHFDGPPLAKDERLKRATELLKSLKPQAESGPVPFDLKQIVAWLGGEQAAAAPRIDHTVCFHEVSGECIEDAYITSPAPNVLVITSVDRP